MELGSVSPRCCVAVREIARAGSGGQDAYSWSAPAHALKHRGLLGSLGVKGFGVREFKGFVVWG